MPAYNKTFDLTPDDLDLIESALREKQRKLSASGTGEPCETMRGTHELLGRLHNQKNFYRPKAQAYVSG